MADRTFPDYLRTLAAAIAAAKLKRFNPAQMLDLINCSATMGMSTSRNAIIEGATVRNIYTGHSGYMGLMAAQLVECGFTGESDAVYQIHGRVISDGFDRARVVEDTPDFRAFADRFAL